MAGQCFLPPIKGPCKARHERYYFDSEAGLCKKFDYGGCEGNENRFKTLEECSEKCNIQDVNTSRRVCGSKNVPVCGSIPGG